MVHQCTNCVRAIVLINQRLGPIFAYSIVCDCRPIEHFQIQSVSGIKAEPGPRKKGWRKRGRWRNNSFHTDIFCIILRHPRPPCPLSLSLSLPRRPLVFIIIVHLIIYNINNNVNKCWEIDSVNCFQMRCIFISQRFPRAYTPDSSERNGIDLEEQQGRNTYL